MKIGEAHWLCVDKLNARTLSSIRSRCKLARLLGRHKRGVQAQCFKADHVLPLTQWLGVAGGYGTRRQAAARWYFGRQIVHAKAPQLRTCRDDACRAGITCKCNQHTYASKVCGSLNVCIHASEGLHFALAALDSTICSHAEARGCS